MSFTFTAVGASVVVALAARWAFLLLINYRKAHRLGLPVLISPVDAMNPLWLVTHSYVVPILKLLPFGLGSWHVYTSFGWTFPLKYTMHERLGDSFILVSPGSTNIMVAEGSAVEDILSRRKDFQKSEEMYKALEIFGPNVDTVEGHTWQRHRRITTPPFNERNSNLVWQESLRQSNDMLQQWVLASSKGVTSSNTDTMLLALHVLTLAGFGKSYSFRGGLQELPEGHTMTYRDSLKIILSNLYTTIFTSMITLPRWLAPAKVTEVVDAVQNFKQYMVEMVEEERAAIAEKSVESDNLMSVLLRASESDGSRTGLSDAEIYGNLFIYNLAGHETTANTLAYAVGLLSTNQNCQEWLSEEIDAVLGTNDAWETWEYEETFPKLQRCLAYETLRLYGPVFVIPRYTNQSSQRLVLDGKDRIIPPKTFVSVDSIALHTMPKHWGSDSLEWKPSRWIKGESFEEESFLQPNPGTFVPWAAGPRVCPGRRFSQVEFVAVMTRLFKNHRVQPVLENAESMADASKRVLSVVEDSTLEVTLKMKRPERIKLRWTRKKE